MSDYYISFIPEEPNYVPDSKMVEEIKGMAIEDCVQQYFEVSDVMHFADAGENLESIACPFCKADLQEWWGGAMDLAYSGESGFTNLVTVVPCCNQSCSLNDLVYHFPQGFYKVKLTIEPTPDYQVSIEDVCDKLKEVSGMQWRVIHTRV